jgi:DNA-binding FrmR family transcriptional regulator
METRKRINRIIGQMKGIERMITEKRNCNEILQQIAAVKRAIDGLSKELVVKNICRYMPKRGIKKIEETLERAISI